MPGEYDELRAKLRRLLTDTFAPKPQFTRGLLGDGLGNVTVPGRPDKNYVRFNRGSTKFFEVFNVTVNAVNDWPVLIGELPWLPGLTQVVGTDWAAYEQSGWDDNVGASSPHARTHEWPDGLPGSDPVNIYMRSIVPLRAYALGTGSTTIYVNSYEYENPNGSGTVWGGLPGVDLSPVMSALTTGTARLMGIYLNPNTNTLGIVTGAIDIFTDASLPPSPQFPRGVLPAGRIRVYGGQAYIAEVDIRDARQPFGFIPTGTASSGGYPFNVLTVDATDTDADYSTVAAAVSAAVSGDVIKIGPGNYSCDDIAITKQLEIWGVDPDKTILTTSTGGTMFDVTSTLTLETITLSGAASGSALSGIKITSGGVVKLRDSFITLTVSGAAAYGVEINNGTFRSYRTEISVNTSTNKMAVYSHTSSANVVELVGGKFAGTAYDIQIDTGELILRGPQFANDIINVSSSVDAHGNARDSQGRDAGTLLLSNGSSISAGQIGYLVSTGKFNPISSAEYADNWMAASIAGGTGWLFGKNRGRVSLQYTGTAPSSGDFLTTSATTGKVQARSTLHPSVLAVATAAGTGGMVEALLHINRVTILLSSSNDLFKVASASDSDWQTTINGAPSGLSVTYTSPLTNGNENSIVPAAAGQLFLLVLHNTTRGTSAHITAVNTTTKVITVLDSSEISGWQSGDTIEVRSQTNTDSFGGTPSYFYDLDSNTTEIPAMAVGLVIYFAHVDSGGAGQTLLIHPFETGASSKRQNLLNQVTSVTFPLSGMIVPVIDSTFCLGWVSGGSGTKTITLRILGAIVAAP